MIKNLAIDTCDLGARFAKWAAKHWLDLSVWLSDVAESIETGDSLDAIRKQRTRGI